MDRVSPKDKKRRRRPVKRQQATTRESKSLNITTKKKSYHHITINMIMAGKKYLALVDSGAQDNYISPTVVNKDKILWINKRNPYQLNTVEGKPLSYQQG